MKIVPNVADYTISQKYKKVQIFPNKLGFCSEVNRNLFVSLYSYATFHLITLSISLTVLNKSFRNATIPQTKSV